MKPLAAPAVPAPSAPRRFADDAARWAAVVARDAGADGAFLFSVDSTGIYCRPGCPARTPKRENVRFHATREAAEQAGFRPCRRCRPETATADERRAALVAAACRAIECAEEIPTLAVLAGGIGLSSHHFHRLFKAVTGVTPRAYALACRDRRLRDALPVSRKVTDALYAAGHGSSAGFYDRADDVLGMAPARYRRGGEGETLRYALGGCSLGRVLVASTARGLCAILLGDADAALVDDLRRRFPRARIVAADASYARTLATVAALVDTPRDRCALPLDIRGTAFQRRVWQALRAIPAGATVSYAEIARRIGVAPRAVRAVAAAVAANPLAVAIPCHRVLRKDGGLAGYRWGIERKQALLAREAKRPR